MPLLQKLTIALLLVALGVITRVTPHPWNFTPIAAIALFAGTYLGVRYAVLVPLLSMLAGDVMLGFDRLPITLTIYGCIALIGGLGLAVRRSKSFETVIAASLLGSVGFFLFTNYAVWQFTTMYAHTPAGLFDCYLMALPFFRNTVLGDLFFCGMLFGSWELVRAWSRSRYFFRFAVARVR